MRKLLELFDNEVYFVGIMIALMTAAFVLGFLLGLL
jgi:hypothetical protein